jgi:hypothetical protein
MATAGAAGLSVKESVIVSRAYIKPSLFTKAAADQIVYAGCVLLILTDATISLSTTSPNSPDCGDIGTPPSG